jgi:hypothetical protein
LPVDWHHLRQCLIPKEIGRYVRALLYEHSRKKQKMEQSLPVGFSDVSYGAKCPARRKSYLSQPFFLYIARVSVVHNYG